MDISVHGDRTSGAAGGQSAFLWVGSGPQVGRIWGMFPELILVWTILVAKSSNKKFGDFVWPVHLGSEEGEGQKLRSFRRIFPI